MKLSSKLIPVVLFLLLLSVAVQSTVSVKIYSRDEQLNSSNITVPRIYIQNTGTETVSNVSYNYYFTTENSEIPVLDNYYVPNGNAILVTDSGSLYHVRYTLTDALQPGQTIPNNSGNSIGLHYNSWNPWTKANDFSNNNSGTFAENQNIPVYLNNVKFYGNEPGNSGSSSGGDPSSPSPGVIKLQNFALYSLQGTYIRDQSVFDGGGAIGSNTTVEVNSQAAIWGNVISGGSVTLHSSSTIYGDVYANGIATRDAGATVNGNIYQNSSVGSLLFRHIISLQE